MVEITLSGPGKNALGTALMQRARAEIAAASPSPILLCGAGDAFSAGLDLAEVASLDGPGMVAFLGLLEGLLRDLWLYPGPTAAFVNGHAIAGGCLLALACDARVSIDNPKARIGLNEVALGLRFPPAVVRLVRARVAPNAIDEVLLGAGLHSPQDALRLGLVDHVSLDAGEIARSRLAALASHPPEAYASIKADLRAGVFDGMDDSAAFLAEIVPVWTSDGIKARIRAILDRSKR
jgi:enoyl-CoA hydratase/carnithine racemase